MKKRKKSAKVCWAIGLLVFQMGSTAISYISTYPFAFFILLVFECIPTIGAIVLISYDHKYTAPISGSVTLLRVWSIGLIWVQPILSLISYGASGTLTSQIFAMWVGSCVFIVISTILLVKDGKDFVKKHIQTNPSDKSQQGNRTGHTEIDSEKEINEQQNLSKQYIISSDNTDKHTSCDKSLPTMKQRIIVLIGIICMISIILIFSFIN